MTDDLELPNEIMVWPSVGSWTGTWATTRYPEEAVAYVPKSRVEALTAERLHCMGQFDAKCKEVNRLSAKVARLTAERDDARKQAGMTSFAGEGYALMELRALAAEAKLERAALAGYAECAKTRHVTLGKAVAAAIRAMKGASNG